ncbi:hypothetical protein GCM10011341_26410 [Frigidibacter albus]|nr:hypothetical protein GCM10011341_26410 [Frigidibacter albus]
MRPKIAASGRKGEGRMVPAPERGSAGGPCPMGRPPPARDAGALAEIGGKVNLYGSLSPVLSQEVQEIAAGL